jgi:hypothetical protein
LSTRQRPVATACLLALATSIFYGLALGRQPIGRDEARVLSHAQRPVQGRPPLVINTGDAWLQPLQVYATTLAHAIKPGFFAGRWASVSVAAISAGLMFLVGWRLFGGYIAALAATLALILTPAHMTFGRQGIEAVYIVPFVLLWLYALAGFVDKDRPEQMAAAAAALGAGVYSTTAAPLTMAFLWLTMIVVLWMAGRRKLSTMAVAAISFAVMLAPLAVWFAFNPHTYGNSYGAWAIHATHLRNPLAGLSAAPDAIGATASAYWSLVNPSFLFLSGADSRAPLHWLLAPLIVIGIYQCVRKSGPMATIVLIGAVVAPLAGAGFGRPRYIANAMALLPFMAVLAGYGVDAIRELVAPTPVPADRDE